MVKEAKVDTTQLDEVIIKTHGSESRPCKVESDIMTRPLHVSVLQEGALWKFCLLLLAHRLRYRSETLYQCLICDRILENQS